VLPSAMRTPAVAGRTKANAAARRRATPPGGCTRADEQVAAAVGLARCATTRFDPAGRSMAGLLTGLPAP
jgi:hypothetical protein